MRGVRFDDGHHPAIRELDLSLEAGERLVAFGASGSGKRTFLKLAAGILKPDAGTIESEPLGYVPSEGGLLSNLSLLDNAILPLVYHKRLPLARAAERGRAALSELGLGDRLERRPATVSASARRLAQLARAMLVEPSVFLLDDPLEENRGALKATLDGTSKAGKDLPAIIADVKDLVADLKRHPWRLLRKGDAQPPPPQSSGPKQP